MAEIPVTKVSLLDALALDPANARWTEFAHRYMPMMEAFLCEHFPYLEKDDIIQETLISLVKIMPGYRYSPDETGHFRNYLTGILYRKALKASTRNARRAEVMASYKAEPKAPASDPAAESSEAAWRKAIYEIALRQLMADQSIKERTKQVFARTAIGGEKPEAVAEAYGITRNAVDQMKNRMMQKLKELVGALVAVRGEEAK